MIGAINYPNNVTSTLSTAGFSPLTDFGYSTTGHGRAVYDLTTATGAYQAAWTLSGVSGGAGGAILALSGVAPPQLTKVPQISGHANVGAAAVGQPRLVDWSAERLWLPVAPLQCARQIVHPYPQCHARQAPGRASRLRTSAADPGHGGQCSREPAGNFAPDRARAMTVTVRLWRCRVGPCRRETGGAWRPTHRSAIGSFYAGDLCVIVQRRHRVVAGEGCSWHNAVKLS